jgi:hypothetical protein
MMMMHSDGNVVSSPVFNERMAQALDPLTVGMGMGTMIDTTEGPMLVESLRPGHEVIALDGTAVRVMAVSGHLDGQLPEDMAHVVVRAGVLGATQDICLGADQHVLLCHMLVAALFGHPAALIRVRRLVDGNRVVQQLGPVPLALLWLDRPAVVQAGGLFLCSATRTGEALPYPELTGSDARCVGESGLFVRRPGERNGRTAFRIIE